MSDTTAVPADAPTAEPTQENPTKPAGDEPLGEPGKRALEAEREARRTAETNLTTLRSEFEGFKTALTEALGVKPKKGDGADALAQVQEQLARMQLDNAVLALATEHKITDKDDLDLLRATKDEQARVKLAVRLASKDTGTPGTPKPDATQGGTGEPVKADPGPGLARLRQAYSTPE